MHRGHVLCVFVSSVVCAVVTRYRLQTSISTTRGWWSFVGPETQTLNPEPMVLQVAVDVMPSPRDAPNADITPQRQYALSAARRMLLQR